ncbi:MAG: zinc-dependent metalloprotease family protein [Cyanobacteriota bacterium]
MANRPAAPIVPMPWELDSIETSRRESITSADALSEREEATATEQPSESEQPVALAPPVALRNEPIDSGAVEGLDRSGAFRGVDPSPAEGRQDPHQHRGFDLAPTEAQDPTQADGPGGKGGPPSRDSYSGEVCDELLPEAALGIGSTDPTWSSTPLLDPSLTFRLHSDPTATRLIYLDFDGHTTTGTSWNNSTMGSSFYSPAYDIDGNPASFSSSELTSIQQMWQRVASDFAPFDVDVTTQAPPLDWLKRSSSSDTTYGMRVVITSYGPYSSSAGGVSFVGTFTASSDTPVFVYARSVLGVAEASSHEVGHTLGLSHDGKGTSTYYGGHGSGETGWAPIMGSSYNRSVTTWDIGQYTGTNNGSSTANYGKGPDDLAVITGYNGFGYQPDLVGNSLTTATPLTISAGQVSQFGTIETRQDLDCYSFDLLTTSDVNLSFEPYSIRSYVDTDGVWGGSSTATASRVSDLYSSTSYVENGSNLDLLVSLSNSTGKVLATSNPTGLAASLSLQGLAAGRYTLSLDGTGYGNPMATTPSGYTDADSLGFYRISGSITGTAASLLALASSSDPIVNENLTGTADTKVDRITGLGYTSVDGRPDGGLSNPHPTGEDPNGIVAYPISFGNGGVQLQASNHPENAPWLHESDQTSLGTPGLSSTPPFHSVI